jgi:hypothetical protein
MRNTVKCAGTAGTVQDTASKHVTVASIEAGQDSSENSGKASIEILPLEKRTKNRKGTLAPFPDDFELQQVLKLDAI